MTPEAAASLDKARECLAKAESMLAAWPDEAGRAAYLAGLHAARALLFETTGRVFKTHSGLHGAFSGLVRNDPRFDAELRTFLGQAYNLKTIADYGTDAGAKVSPDLASSMVETAKRFVAAVTTLLKHGH